MRKIATAIALTGTLALVGCGADSGFTDEELAAAERVDEVFTYDDAETTPTPSSTPRWETLYDAATSVYEVTGGCGSIFEIQHATASCGDPEHGFYLISLNTNEFPEESEILRRNVARRDKDDTEVLVSGDGWAINCFENAVRNCSKLHGAFPEAEYLEFDAAPKTVETTGLTTPSAPITSPSQNSVSATQMDKIYAETVRGYGVDISDQQFASVSAPVCDSYENGGGLDAAISTVAGITGHDGWRATRIVQGVVVSKCSEFAELTY